MPRQDDFAPGLPRFKAELKIDIEKFDALWVAFEVGSGQIDQFFLDGFPFLGRKEALGKRSIFWRIMDGKK